MNEKQFEELLKLCGRGKKEEEETRILSGAELREHFGKAFLASLKDERWTDGKRKI